jgi:hypothetical protein
MLRADKLHEGVRSVNALEPVARDGRVVLGVRSPEFHEIGDVPLAGMLFNVFTVRNGRIASIQDYANRGDALRAAGADEPGSRDE